MSVFRPSLSVYCCQLPLYVCDCVGSFSLCISPVHSGEPGLCISTVSVQAHPRTPAQAIMEAGMSASARGRNGTSAGKNLNPMRGLDQTAFIDVSMETPLNQQQPQQQSNGHPPAIMQNGPPQSQQFRGYPPAFNGPNGNNSQMYMNPQMSSSVNGLGGNNQQMMYMNPNASSMVSVPQSMGGMGMGMNMEMGMNMGMNMGGMGAMGGGGGYQQQHPGRIRQRRNSNASMGTMGTMSVNRFMKKQWNKIGGGDDDDGDGDGEDAKIELDTSENEISFEDLQHIRGDRPGFGLTDTTPYIPTLKVSAKAGSKVTGEQYRKMQMAQKKAFAMNLARQNKQAQQQQQLPPRSMSLQTFGNGGFTPNYGAGFPGGFPPNQQMPPNGMMMQQPSQQQHPLPPIQQNGVMMMPPMQMQNGMMMPPMAGGPPVNQPPFNPRSMSLQTDSAMKQRNFQSANGGPNNWNPNPVVRSQTPNSSAPNSPLMNLPSPSANSAVVGRTPASFSPKLGPSERREGNSFGADNDGTGSKEAQPTVSPPADNVSTTIPNTPRNKKSKIVSKIEFSPVTEDEDDGNDDGVAEQVRKMKHADSEDSPINETVLPTLPTVNGISNSSSQNVTPTKNLTPSKRRENGHQISRSGVGSIVSFDSLNQKDQKLKQDKLYHARNNSSQKTIFYSAAEFQAPLSQDSLAFKEEAGGITMKKQLSTQAEEAELSTSTALEDVKEDADGSADIASAPAPHVNIDDINDSLDKMVLKTSPVVNHNAFASNYGSYGDSIRDSTSSYKSVEHTQPLHLNLKETKQTNTNNNNKVNDIDRRDTYSSLSPAKTNDSGNLVDMTVSLNSHSKESSPLKAPSIRKEILARKVEIPPLKKEFTPPPSSIGLTADSVTAATSVKSTPSKIRSIDSEPRTPISITSPSHTSYFTPEQYGLLNDNTQLLQELELVTTELASSVSREIALEDNLKKRSRSMSREGSSIEKKRDSNDVNSTITDSGDSEINKRFVKDITELEIDAQLKTPSQYAATITSLTKQLNEERRRRYLVEGMLLKLQETSTGADLQDDLLNEKKKVGELTDELNNIKESEQLHKTEKDLLRVENDALKLEIEELQRKYGNMEKEVVPRLKNQVEMLEEMINSLKPSNGPFASM